MIDLLDVESRLNIHDDCSGVARTLIGPSMREIQPLTASMPGRVAASSFVRETQGSHERWHALDLECQ